MIGFCGTCGKTVPNTVNVAGHIWCPLHVPDPRTIKRMQFARWMVRQGLLSDNLTGLTAGERHEMTALMELYSYLIEPEPPKGGAGG